MAGLNNWRQYEHPGISRPSAYRCRHRRCCRLLHCAGDEMTDRELLEAAAKAAGMPAFASGATGLRVSHDGVRSGYIWNPLTDDGDALRLAVKLNITVSNSEAQKHACASSIKVSGICLNTHQGDPYAATRRAIVRAAAEIGKTNP